MAAKAVELLESKAHTLLEQAEAHRDLSASLAHDEGQLYRQLP